MGNILTLLFGPHTQVTTPSATMIASTPAPTAAPFSSIAPTAAPWTPGNPTWQSLRSGTGANLCLNAAGGIVACDGSTAQNWFYDGPSGMVVNQANGTCLTVGGIDHNVPISLRPCDPSNANQQWAQPKVGSLVLKANNNLSLDLPNGDPKYPVSTWFVNNNPAQDWRFK